MPTDWTADRLPKSAASLLGRNASCPEGNANCCKPGGKLAMEGTTRGWPGLGCESCICGDATWGVDTAAMAIFALLEADSLTEGVLAMALAASAICVVACHWWAAYMDAAEPCGKAAGRESEPGACGMPAG